MHMLSNPLNHRPQPLLLPGTHQTNPLRRRPIQPPTIQDHLDLIQRERLVLHQCRCELRPRVSFPFMKEEDQRCAARSHDLSTVSPPLLIPYPRTCSPNVSSSPVNSQRRGHLHLDLTLNFILLLPGEINTLIIPMRHQSDLITESIALPNHLVSTGSATAELVHY